MTAVAIHLGAPLAYRDLVWSIFFEQRGRGLHLAAHFPWIEHETPRVWYAVAREGTSTLGGLAVREDPPRDGYRPASVGLVCVSPEHRGRGISRLLLDAAISEARSRGIDALRLWTGNPAIYLSSGFKPHDSALFGWVDRTDLACPDNFSAKPERRKWPSPGGHGDSMRGLPPFATEGSIWEFGGATLTVVEDPAGPIVAEWSGSSRQVASLMAQALPPRIRLNALATDELPTELTRLGWQCQLNVSKLQMLLTLREHSSPTTGKNTEPRMLDRI